MVIIRSYNMEVDGRRKRDTADGPPRPLPAETRRRLGGGASRDPLTWLQRQYHPEPASSTAVLPTHAYNLAVTPHKFNESYTEFEQKLWLYCDRAGIHLAISRRTVQQRRHLLAIRHLAAVEKIYIQRHEISQQSGWSIAPLRPRSPSIRLTNVPVNLSNDELLTDLFHVRNTQLSSLRLARDEVIILKYRQHPCFPPNSPGDVAGA